jgi:predicted ATPase/class 3 adenylate cyclase
VISRDVTLALAHDAPVRPDLPPGTVTFLFTDVEGSTRLLHSLGAQAYAEALAEHRRAIRDACARHDGVEVDTQGDAFFVAFPTAPRALAAAEEMTQELASGPIRVRIGLHTGTPLLTEEGYVGGDVHRAARIAAAGHGGQVLVSSSTAELLDADLLDLGAHRFKDLGAPERVYQFGGEEFPALKSLFRTNLPIPTTPFLGRERELAEVVGLLGTARLLTLTGPGGTGKTRLAAQAAGLASAAYPDGVWWIPLAALREPELVLETAAQVVGSKNGLAEHIADKSMLLLFDNFEQVVEAASDVASLLVSCPQLDLIVTSREPLHVRGEQEYPVPPLVHEEGVGFFLARARAVKPDFESGEAVSEICRRLDDLPLALELAAARVKALSSEQILERLEQRLPLLTGGARDLPERQRTLRATIAWSYELLTNEEQQLFARLAVFRGGCTLEAAEQVCEADLDTLQSLVDKSLLRHTDERYWMLETIREYATDRLEESGEAEEFKRRHAEHFLALGEEAEPHLRKESEESREWLDRFDREHDNLRAALARLEASGETQLVLRLAGAAWWFWDARSHLVEGRRRLESALDADGRPTAARARALNGAGELAINAGDVAAARLWAAEAVPLHRAFGDAWGSAFSARLLGHATLDEGDLQRAKPLIEESVRLFREVGDQPLFATHLLAWTYYRLGDGEKARTLWEDNLQRARATANRNIEALSLGALADTFAVEEGRVEDALSMLTEAYRIHRDLGTHDVQTAMDMGRLARALVVAGRAVAAARVLASAEALYEEIGVRARPLNAERDESTLSAIRAQLNDSAFAKAWEEGRALLPDEAVALALDS